MDVARIIIAVVLVLFFVAGLRRGLIRQVLEVLGIIAAFIGAFYLAHLLAGWLETRFDLSYRVALVISAVALFTGIVTAFHYLGVGMQRLFRMTVLGWFDRMMGGVFGALKGVMLVSLVLVVLLSLPVGEEFKDRLREDPVTGNLYPVLPVLFDMVLSRTGTDFESVAGIGENIDIEAVKEKASELGEKLEKKRDRLEKKAGPD